MNEHNQTKRDLKLTFVDACILHALLQKITDFPELRFIFGRTLFLTAAPQSDLQKLAVCEMYKSSFLTVKCPNPEEKFADYRARSIKDMPLNSYSGWDTLTICASGVALVPSLHAWEEFKRKELASSPIIDPYVFSLHTQYNEHHLCKEYQNHYGLAAIGNIDNGIASLVLFNSIPTIAPSYLTLTVSTTSRNGLGLYPLRIPSKINFTQHPQKITDLAIAFLRHTGNPTNAINLIDNLDKLIKSNEKASVVLDNSAED